VTSTLHLLISLLPVLAFLATLMFLDSFKLVSVPSVLRALGAGAAAALLSYLINLGALEQVDVRLVRMFVAPTVEEILKSLYLIYLVRTRRTGFMVDAAIYGFAIGTGFALIENIYYWESLSGSSILLWVIRGFGTAVLHGSTTALFAILTKGLSDRHESVAIRFALPGLATAIGIHMLYNSFLLHPVLQTLIVLAVLPAVVAVVFDRSEKATRDWLGVGFDSDVELLELIVSGDIHDTRVGHYLESLRSRFPAMVVADMLCLLRIHLELSARAKGILLARQAGLRLEPDESVQANLKELRYLEGAVGRTGMLAVLPFLNYSSRELWQLYMLGK
jgi:RsiW-degrading membrane proteinase PrsW (M82 family)